MAGSRIGAMSQALDVQGSSLLEDGLTASLEGIIGRVLDSGADGAITAATKRFASASAAFTTASPGQFIRITGAGEAGNNGTWLITEYVDGNTVVLGQATTLVDESSLDWTQSRANSLEDDMNYMRSDRKAIKGTGTYKDALPTFQRPSAIGTDVPASLTALAGKTLDAYTEVRSVRQAALKMRPSITGADLDTTISDETAAFEGYHFSSADLNSFITISGSAQGANGTYRIKAVTDGHELELEGLNPSAGETDLSWALVAERKAVLSSRGHADATDRRGIPLADSGAYDETKYECTFADVVDPLLGGAFVSNADLPIWGRSYGAELAPSSSSVEGVFFVTQFKTGDNDGTATTRAWEIESGRTGADGTVTDATKNFTSATAAFTAADVGKYLNVWGCGAENAGYCRITAVASATQCTVERSSNFVTDPNSGSLSWQISKYPASIDVYNGDRYRLDELSETAHRTTLIGGIISDAELAEAINKAREAIGIVAGDSDLDGKLTNLGNYFPFVNLSASPTVVEALNELNEQIGNRDYTGAVLVDNETITASLQRIADAIAGANIVRTIERLAAGITAGTSHVLPGAISYTLDGTGNGRNMFVFWRGLLRDPGSLEDDDDYEEEDTTHIIPFADLNAGDHISYLILQ